VRGLESPEAASRKFQEVGDELKLVGCVHRNKCDALVFEQLPASEKGIGRKNKSSDLSALYN
jgi:hypothetical protein